MKKSILFGLAIAASVAVLSLSVLASCVSTPSQSSSFYNAGAGDFAPTGGTFGQLLLYRFDTSSTGRTLTLPSAADIVAAISSPVVGEVLIFGVTADGDNVVTIAGGANVNVTACAATVRGNTTLTIYCVFDSISAGSQAVTVY